MRNSYYIGMALQSLERARELNSDSTVGIHISRAIDAIIQMNMVTKGSSDRPETDPYEINEFNSAI